MECSDLERCFPCLFVGNGGAEFVGLELGEVGFLPQVEGGG